MSSLKNRPLEWSKNLTIYEVNLRQYTPSGTIKEFENHLPRLKELGVGILWFMPIQPIGSLNRKGTLGSYYSIKDYTAVNPDLGTLEEFKDLVTKIHDMGMYVILDWVANHTAWDNELTVTNPSFYSRDKKGNFHAPFPEWADVIKLDYNNDQVHDYMISAMKFWIEETNIDGFRCDMANLVPLYFWRIARVELDRVKPVFMLAEAEQQELLFGAFDAIYNWNFHHVMNNIAKEENNAWTLYDMIEREVYNFPSHAYQMMFISNHDENSWNGSDLYRLGIGLEAYVALYFTLTGIPLIYSGQEAGLGKSLSFFEKDEIEWKDDKMFPLYKKLVQLKKQNKALWSGPYGGNLVMIDTMNKSNTIAYLRIKGESKVLVLINLSNYDQFAHLHDSILEGCYKDAISDDKFCIYDDYYFTLKPWEYKVLELESAD